MKKRTRFYSSTSGFTLVEILIALGVVTAVGTVALSYMESQTRLFAKNTALNQSHTSLRSGLDRLANELQQTHNLPNLIDTSGAATAVTPAAGLQYDRLLGSPYVLTHPGGAGLPAVTTSVTVTRSTDPLASPPIPALGDVLLINTGTSPIRAQISAVTINPQTLLQWLTQRQSFTLTFAAQLGKAVNWDPTRPETAKLVRRKAFIVMPAGGHSELRFYQNFEPLPALDDPDQYRVITDEVSTVGGGDTPFFIDTSGTDKLVKASLRIRAKDYVNSLAGKQLNSFNTFVRIETTLPSRLRPKS